jgi:hypothetical protein
LMDEKEHKEKMSKEWFRWQKEDKHII